MKNIIKTMAALMMCMAFALMCLIPSVSARAAVKCRYVDEIGGLLTGAQTEELESKLDSMSEKYNADIVIAVVDDFSEDSWAEAADDYFDNNGYGMGSDGQTGIILFVCEKYDGLYWMSTCGKCIDYFSDEDISYLGSLFRDDLENKNYNEAFNEFADGVATEISGETGFHPVKKLAISLIVGLIAAGIYILILRGELKSVEANDLAADYVVEGSMKINESREIFLYKKVDVTVKEDSHSSGGSSHMSSSGRSHGGGR